MIFADEVMGHPDERQLREIQKAHGASLPKN
jgi:hypothetical protein